MFKSTSWFWIGAGAILLALSIFKYLSLYSGFFDLGAHDKLFYFIANIGDLLTAIRGHIFPFSIFYALVYKIFPQPFVLLFFQTTAIITGGIFVAKISKRINLSIAKFIPWLYILYFAVWYNCLFDFHFGHLFVLFCAIFFWLLHKEDTKKVKIATVFICILSCLTKEVFPLSVLMMGIYVLLKKKWYSTGAFICLFSTFYFILVTSYVTPYFNAGKEAPTIWPDAFGYLGSNMKEVFLNLLTHPWLLITETFSDWQKSLYIIAIFGPFLFIPLFAPLELLPGLPQLFISLLSHNPNNYALSSQYTAGLIVPVFVAFIYGIKKLESWNVLTLKRITVFVLLSSLFFHILLSPSPISRIFWVELVPQYHYTAYIPRKRDAMIKRAVKTYIPGDFNISVSTQNSINHAHLAHRHYYFCFPRGVTEPARVPDWGNRSFKGLIRYTLTGYAPPMKFKEIYADYVVIDLKRELFIKGKGCITAKEKREFFNLFSKAKKYYKIIFEKDGFYILKRL